MSTIIFKSVGHDGVNDAEDVRVVQRLLNGYFGVQAGLLKVDGIAGPKTIAAINDFQGCVTGTVDGRIDPNGPAIKKLAELHVKSAMAGINPKIASLLKQTPLSPKQPAGALLDSYWALLRKS
jgi:peptidoglycan hydrolase-like protein with peptidoglycan-binding domain